MVDAHANILQAERVSRSADPLERTAALAEAARCLVLLEKNLGQAEAFVTEADAVAHREGSASASVSFALGMIAAHRGETTAAVEAFREARRLSRQQGEHLVEFGALEHQVMVEVDRGGYAEAVELAAQLAELGGRVRPGAEIHAGRALLALASLLHDGSAEGHELQSTVDALRRADAKYELSFVLIRWAEYELSRDRLDDARQRATEAFEVATAMGRSSDVAVATTVLAEVAHRQRKRAERARCLAELEQLGTRELSAVSRQRIAEMTSRLAAAK
jgi:tetratricopeptide (TPR) repeat protein